MLRRLVCSYFYYYIKPLFFQQIFFLDLKESFLDVKEEFVDVKEKFLDLKEEFLDIKESSLDIKEMFLEILGGNQSAQNE